MTSSLLFIVTALASLLVSSAQATAILDFSAAVPTPGGEQGGNHWTTIASAGLTDLLDAATGLDSGWDLTLTTPATTGLGGTAINGNGDAAPFDQSFAIIDGLFSNRNTARATLAFSNLTPNQAYSFTTYSDRVSGWADAEILTVIGTGPASIPILKDTVTDFQITSDPTGIISFTFGEGPNESTPIGDNAVLNALRISSIPEPSSFVLILLGATGLGVARRRI
jgi:hypothetical protein